MIDPKQPKWCWAKLSRESMWFLANDPHNEPLYRDQGGEFLLIPSPDELKAMKWVCEAAGPAIEALEIQFGHLALMANFGELVSAFDTLRALQEVQK